MRSNGGTQYFGWWELAMLIVANKLSMLTTYAPILTGSPATRDAWLSAWVAAGTAFLIALIPYTLLRRFPEQSIFTVNTRVLGEWAGRLLNLVYAGMFIHLAGVAIRMFSEVFEVAMLPETPVWVLNAMIAALSVVGVLGGMEVLGRLADIVAPAIFVTVLLVAVLALGLIQPGRLLPVFEYGPGPMLRQALTPIAIFGEMSWVLLLGMPYLRQTREGLKAMWVATAISGTAVSFGAALLIAMMGPELIDRTVFPTLAAVRLVRVAEFLTRVEWMMAGLWMGSMYAKTGLLLFGAVSALRAALPLSKVSPPLVVLCAGIAALLWGGWVISDTMQLLTFFEPDKALPVALMLEAGLPFIALVAAWVRGRRGAPHGSGVAHG